MADVATLGVKLEATGTEQVVSALNQVERAVQGTHQSTVAMGAAIGVASSVASAAFGAIAHAAQGALGAVGGATIGLNASLEQATIGFTTLLKSGEAAQTFLKDLQQFAQSTPFEFKDLIPQAQRLQAMGFAAKDVIPILRDVGNVAAAMGSGKEGIDRITLAIGQMSAATVVHAQDINQLIQAGVPAWELLAQATGKSTAEVRQLSEAGKISADVFITAFRAWSQNNVGTMMEAQSRTFIGAVSNIKDALGIAVAAGFKPLFDTVRDLAVTFADFVQSETFGVWATDLKITLGELTPAISSLAGWLMSQLPTAMSAAEAGAHAFVAVVQDIGPKIADLAQNVGPVLAAAWEKLGAVLSPVGAALAAIGAPLATVYGAFAQLDELINGTLSAALSGLGGQLADYSRNLVNIGAALSTALGGSETGALDALGVAAGRVGDALSALGTIASTAFQDLQIAGIAAWNVIIPKLEEVRGWLETTLPSALATLQESWDGFWSHAGPMVQAMWNAVQPILGAAIGIELGILQKVLETFKGVWDGVWGGIQTALEKVAPLIGALASTFGGAFAGLSDTITAALNSMQTPVAVAAEETGATIRNNIVKGVAPVAAEVAATVEPAAAAVAKMGTSATVAAPAVAGLGSAGQTAAAGLSATTKEAKTLDDVMAQLAKSTTPEAVQASLMWQNANAGISEAMRSLDMQTASQVLAMKNAGDGYGAAERALRALGVTTEDVNRIMYGNVSAHDAIAAAAARAAGAIRDEQSAQGGTSGPGINTGRLGAPVSGTGYGTATGATGATGAAVPNPHDTGKTMAAGFRENVGSGPADFGREIGAGFREAAGLTTFDSPAAGFGTLTATGYGGTLQGAQQTLVDLQRRQAEEIAAVYNNPDLGPVNQSASAAGESAWLKGNAADAIKQKYAAQLAYLQAQIAGLQAVAEEAGSSVQAATTTATRSVTGLGQAFATTSTRVSQFAADASGQMYLVGQAAEQAAAQAQQAWAAALRAGETLVAGMNLGKGLTYGQIYGNTATQGTGSTGLVGTLGVPGAFQRLQPGNYGGVPIVDPLTAGTFRGYADGGWVTEPVVGRGMRSGAPYAFGERGPEYVSPGGAGTVVIQMPVTITGSDALRDPRLYEQLLDCGLTQAMRKRGLV